MRYNLPYPPIHSLVDVSLENLAAIAAHHLLGSRSLQYATSTLRPQSLNHAALDTFRFRVLCLYLLILLQILLLAPLL